MECYHCATIHPELTEVLPEFADGYAAQYFVGHGAEFGDDIEGFTVDGSEGVERLPGVSAEQDRRYYAITIKPQVFINLVPDHVIFHRMYPLAADRTIVECDWLYLPEVVESRRGRQRLGRAVPPGQPAGLRGLRAVPAGHELAGLRARAACWCPASTTSASSTSGCTPRWAATPDRSGRSGPRSGRSGEVGPVRRGGPSGPRAAPRRP